MSFQAYLDTVEEKTGKTPNDFIAEAKKKIMGWDWVMPGRSIMSSAKVQTLRCGRPAGLTVTLPGRSNLMARRRGPRRKNLLPEL